MYSPGAPRPTLHDVGSFLGAGPHAPSRPSVSPVEVADELDASVSVALDDPGPEPVPGVVIEFVVEVVLAPSVPDVPSPVAGEVPVVPDPPSPVVREPSVPAPSVGVVVALGGSTSPVEASPPVAAGSPPHADKPAESMIKWYRAVCIV
jgi:hypothetical protein